MPAVSKVTLVRFRDRFVERANLKNLHFFDHPRQQCSHTEVGFVGPICTDMNRILVFSSLYNHYRNTRVSPRVLRPLPSPGMVETMT